MLNSIFTIYFLKYFLKYTNNYIVISADRASIFGKHNSTCEENLKKSKNRFIILKGVLSMRRE